VVFRFMAGLLGFISAFAGFYLLHFPLKPCPILAPASALGLALLFFGFAALYKPRPKGRPISIGMIVFLIGFFFMLFIALAVYVLLIAGKS
jgi:hypothetical protein